MSQYKPFYFMRHGQTDWNARGICMGQVDIPLNKEGMQEAYNALALIKNLSIKHIYHSPLKRAAMTAQAISNTLGIPCTALEELKACHFGNSTEHVVFAPVLFEQWMSGETPHGWESWQAFSNRVQQGICHIFKHDGPALIISHRGVYKALSCLLGLEQSAVHITGSLTYHEPCSPTQWRTVAIGNR